jgi:hypothetical protein
MSAYVALSDWERARVASWRQPYKLSTRRVYVASWETMCGGEWRNARIYGRACATPENAVASLQRAIDRVCARH